MLGIFSLIVAIIVIDIGNAQIVEPNNSEHYIFPIDTLLDDNDLSFDKKIILSSIRKWQTFSYTKKNLNCQFYPSCSNYFALSIKNNNTYWGIVKGFDRILRCNNHASYYFDNHTVDPKYSIDERMIDRLNLKNNPKPSKSSLIATTLSIIPGLGRAYCGRYIDGLLSFSTTVLLSQIAYMQYKKENYILSYISGSITLTFWLSDFYGAYRSSNIAK